MLKRISHACAAVIALALSLVPLSAVTARAQDALLVVQTAAGDSSFDLARLDSLPQREFRTTTLWTEGEILFSGPALADVLAAAGVVGPMVWDAFAQNDYSVVFNPEDIETGVPIIATRMDGETFGPRKLGPLWIVYPFDSDLRFRSESVYSRSIWQLNRLAVHQDGG